ncbi:TetR/AcrR family transcriptional regulator [Nocardiopsis sp. NPDC101807]|uniref:TetR/AcrR family transcriptional regulator n=1 Tax=Nocardiopsis sp. NPDC101807 TaxID=3364339 RepID=UPI00381B86BC
MNDQEEKVARKRVSADERRSRLLAASLRVMKREGIATATTRAICAEADMPHGAFHYCFHSKKDLYAALLASDIEIDLTPVWPEISPTASAEENIRTLLFAYWSQVESDPDAQLVLFDLGSFVLRDPELRELPKQGYEDSLDKAVGYISRLGEEADLVFVGGERTLAGLVVTTLNGITWSWLAHRDSAAARAGLAQFAELAAGLARRRTEHPAPPLPSAGRHETPSESRGRR